MVLYKAQTYPLPKCFRRSCCLMTLMFICSECILPNFWVGKENMHNISLVFGQIAPSWGCCFVKHDYRFPVSLFVAALPVTGRGSIPAPRPHLWKSQRTSKTLWPVILSTSGHWKATTGWHLAFGQLEESCCMVSVNKPSKAETGVSVWVSRGPKWLP